MATDRQLSNETPHPKAPNAEVTISDLLACIAAK